MKATVGAVAPDSAAFEVGIVPGDCIETVNGHKIQDELDFRFYACADVVTLSVQKTDGTREIIEIEDPDSTDLGISFESALFGGAKRCANNCIFCFIDQLPRGMRDTLYFKDDDARLSFLTGNYITLTNLRDADIQKIIRMRLEPMNVSVHTTDPDLRVSMLRNKHAGRALRYMRQLYDGQIHMNCQIVLVKGVNDGAALDRTIADLSALHPYVTSVSVVPVGITKYREGLYPLVPFTGADAAAVITQVQNWQKKLLETISTRFIYAADEFFVQSGIPIPPATEYEGYYQIENGVGLLRSLEDEFLEAMTKAPPTPNRTVTIATGAAAYKHLQAMADVAMRQYPTLKIQIQKIENRFFGARITVAGLLTGGDIAAQLDSIPLGDCVIIPAVMLRDGTDVFLDDMTVPQLSARLHTPVIVNSCSGFDLWEKIRKE